MISILRPLTPPLALISSAAICAPCRMAWPTMADCSLITPILIGPSSAARAGEGAADRASEPVSTAAHGKRRQDGGVMDESPVGGEPLGAGSVVITAVPPKVPRGGPRLIQISPMGRVVILRFVHALPSPSNLACDRPSVDLRTHQRSDDVMA